LPADVEARTFSWRFALLGRYDVLHLHWPEHLLRSDRTVTTALRRLAVVTLMLRLRLTRTAVVRTVHNPSPHEGGPAAERLLLDALDAQTTLAVHLTERTIGTVLSGRRSIVVPHGHYRDWYRRADDVQLVPGRLLHVGLLRAYKNVDQLIEAFGPAPPTWQLRIVGAPADEVLAAHVARAAAADPRIVAELRSVDDVQLAAEVAAAELVVLPYPARGGSGAQLLALSLDRPVLVPAGPAADALRAEVGADWVQTYEGRLSSDVLRRGLTAVRAAGCTGRPDLSRREWADAGRTYRDAYQEAITLRRAQSGSSPRRSGGDTDG